MVFSESVRAALTAVVEVAIPGGRPLPDPRQRPAPGCGPPAVYGIPSGSFR